MVTLTSSAFAEGGSIPSRYTCDGAGINPPLAISDVPAGAKSLVLIVHDPDAPNGDFVHWLIWNIHPVTTTVAENSLPAGAEQGTTDYGQPGYGPPCPPSGSHRYVFELSALDTTLDLPPSTHRSELDAAIRGHMLETVTLTGRYARSS